MSQERRRIILSAYQCGPGMGSVSQIGYEWFRRLAAQVPVTLVTHERNRAAILGAGLPDGAEVIFIDTEWFAGPLYRLAERLFPRSQHTVFMISSLDYFVFDRAAIKGLRSHSAMHDARLVHVVTPVSTAASTRLHTLGLPVVLGPLNSGLHSPTQFPDILRDDSSWLYPLRNLGSIAERVTGSLRRAAMILVATRATLQSVPSGARHLCRPMVENGVDLDLFTPAPWPSAPTATNPLRLTFVGRLVPFKAVGLLLQAVARVRQQFPVELRIVGDGPMADTWQAAAAELGLADIVTFTGPCSLDAIAREMQWAHVFCLPSVRESGGAVLLEAMACARPVVAVAYGGPAETVDDGVGIGIAPDGSPQVIDALADAFADVVQRPHVWRTRGEEGRRRAEAHYGWAAKINQAIAFYDEVTAS